jgi:tetratricopeptide (TPR) repeat protein
MANQKNHKEALNVEDALTKSEVFVIKHKNLIIGIVLAVIIIVAGVLLYKNFYAAPREEKAQIALIKGQQLFEQQAYSQALNGDSIGYNGFLKVADEFSGTNAANLAHAYAGLCYMNLGKKQEAVTELEKFKGHDAMVAPSILGAIGNCYAGLEQLDKATSYLTQAAEAADNMTLSPIYLMQAGTIYEKQGKFDEALKVYTQIKDKYAQSYQGMNIDKYIERAKLEKK